MNTTGVLAIGFPALLSGGALAEDAALRTEQQKSSYAIGLQIVHNLRGGELTMDEQALSLGIKDALANHQPRLSQEEIMAAYAWQQNELNERRKAKTERSLAASMTFLDENRKNESVKELASGLQYKVLDEGKGAKPKATDTVTVRYRGTFIDGSEFYTSEKQGKPANLNVVELIKGLQEALQLMSQGAKWRIFIPPKLAYGEAGSRDGKIGPNETLVYEVALLSISKSAEQASFSNSPGASQSSEAKAGEVKVAQ